MLPVGAEDQPLYPLEQFGIARLQTSRLALADVLIHILAHVSGVNGAWNQAVVTGVVRVEAGISRIDGRRRGSHSPERLRTAGMNAAVMEEVS